MRACVKCGSTEDINVYTLSAGAETKVIALCEKDARPIVRLFEQATATPPAEGPAATSRIKSHAVIPID